MGQSTDAILFYGYCWHEEGRLIEPDGDGDAPEWPEIVLHRRGVVNPWDACPEYTSRAGFRDYTAWRKAADAWVEANRAAIDAWCAAQKAAREEFGCMIDTHCSNECGMPYVCVTSSRQEASRGCPV